MLETAVVKNYCIPASIKLFEAIIIFEILYSKLFVN